jgi:hypothetical protein
MANKKIGLGILALALVFGLALTGCPAAGEDDKGPDNDNAKLLGKWKENDDTGDPPAVVFEFLDSGMVNWSGSLVAYTYKGTELKIGSVTGTAALSDGGNTLYISGVGGGADGTFSKIGGTGGNPDPGTGGKSIKITGVPLSLSQGPVILYDNSGNEVAGGAWSNTSGEITAALSDHSMAAWKGSGDYAVLFIVPGGVSDTIYCYLNGVSPSTINGFGALPKLAFNSTVTTVEFSKFGEVPPEKLFPPVFPPIPQPPF